MPDKLARELLRGAISYHDHYGWEHGGGVDPICRKTYDPVDIARSAADHGLRAVVLRNLYFTSAGDADLVMRLVPEIQAIGGIFLNSQVGGINPIAVDTAMTYGGGAKFVCMATDSSANGARAAGVDEAAIRADPVRYVTPFDEHKRLKPEMRRVLEIVAEHDVLFETGSLMPDEILSILTSARDIGVKKLLVTHPQPWFCGMTVDQMKQAVDLGAVIEFTWMFYGHGMSYQTRKYGGPGAVPPPVENVGTAFDQIRALGAQNCVLSTDYGTLDLPLPVEGLREFVFCLLDLGLTADEISVMIRDNPARLLGLDPVGA